MVDETPFFNFMIDGFIFSSIESPQLKQLALPPDIRQKLSSVGQTGTYTRVRFTREELLELYLQAASAKSTNKKLLQKLREGLDLLTSFLPNDTVRIIGQRGFMPPGSLGKIAIIDRSFVGQYSFRVDFNGNDKWRWYPSYELAGTSNNTK